MTDADDRLAGLTRAAEAGDASALERELARLLEGAAASVVARTVRVHLPDLPAEDRAAIEGDAMKRLDTILRRFAAGDDSALVESFRAHAATTAADRCRAWLRARRPERTRLENALRYVLRNDRAFVVRNEEDGALRYGLATRGAHGDSGGPAGAEVGSESESDGDRRELPTILRRYFLRRGRNATFAELAATIAEGLGVRDPSAPAAPLRDDPRFAADDPPPDYALLERAVNGTIEPRDEARLRGRLEWDANLAAEIAELRSLRDRIGPSHASGDPLVASFRWIAGAAALVLAFATATGISRRAVEPSGDGSSVDSVPPATGDSIFADGFESGSLARWSS